MPGAKKAAIAAPVDEFPVEKVLDVPYEMQCKGKWCYASVSQSVIKFLTGAKKTQKNVALGVIALGNANNEEEMGDPYKYLDALGLVSYSSESRSPPPWPIIQREINLGHPIIAKVGIHYILIIGYSGTGVRDSKRKLYFIDPLTGPLMLYGTDVAHGTQHYQTGFPTGARAAADGTITIDSKGDPREAWKGYILTKKPDEPRAADGGGTKRRRVTRRRSRH